ncbi:MAG: hypothetical protein NC089_10840 [Bacteroides sp.]|nr:hypothetical protein [Bacteroides sp.]MCM1551035.1 hypothetical protein [Clostridium sp.]
MKQIWMGIIVLLLVCVNICGCQNEDVNGIPSLEEVIQMSDEEATDCLAGYSSEELAAAWGEPDPWPYGVVGAWWHYGTSGGYVEVVYGLDIEDSIDVNEAEAYRSVVLSVHIRKDVYTAEIKASDYMVDEFLEQLGEYDTGYADDVCYNVSWHTELSWYGFSVFKFEKSRDAFLLYDGEIYELESGIGFEGITYFAMADLNQDGSMELYYTVVAGSGNSYCEVGYFDTALKENIVFDTVFHFPTNMLAMKGEGNGIDIYEGSYDRISSVEMSLTDYGAKLARIYYSGDEIVLEEETKTLRE